MPLVHRTKCPPPASTLADRVRCMCFWWALKAGVGVGHGKGGAVPVPIQSVALASQIFIVYMQDRISAYSLRIKTFAKWCMRD